MTQVIRGMAHSAYLASDGISNSAMKDFSRCPQYYHAKHVERVVPDEETKALLDGRRLHVAVLQPELFWGTHVVGPSVNRRTNVGKAEWEAFCAANAGKEIITTDEREMYLRVSDSARRNKRIAAILEAGEAEISCFAKDAETGMQIKCRPDWVIEDIICDCKFMLSAASDQFSRECYNRRYFTQAAFYRYAAGLAMGREFSTFLFIVCEKEPPYLNAVYEADADMLFTGAIEFRSTLARIKKCHETGVWPGYNNDEIIQISLPAWARKSVLMDKTF